MMPPDQRMLNRELAAQLRDALFPTAPPKPDEYPIGAEQRLRTQNVVLLAELCERLDIDPRSL